MNRLHQRTSPTAPRRHGSRFFEIRHSILIAVAFAIALASGGCGSSSEPRPSPPSEATTVVVTPATATVYRGETVRFGAQVSQQSNQAVTWIVDPSIGSIDSTGLYTAPSDLNGASVAVIATSKAVPSATGHGLVTLPAVTFSIAPDAVTIAPGVTVTFSASLVGLDSSQVRWTVQGSGGGTITNGGVYTAPSAKAIDHVVATSAAHENYHATAVALVSETSTPFSSTAETRAPRELHTSTLLPNGKVLLAGGGHPAGYCLSGVSTTEVFDPVARSFASTGNMTIERYSHTSTLLATGDVLIIGGFSTQTSACLDEIPPALASAELYHSSTGSFAASGTMADARGAHSATLLANGRVLIAGGGKLGGGWFPFGFGDGLATAEVYDPATGIFTQTGNMVAARVTQTATLLANGKVLIAGGWGSSDPLTTAELYDPNSGHFVVTGKMISARAGHTATLLRDGRVLITGGIYERSFVGSDTAEIYDPATGLFTATGSMEVARQSHTATLLPNRTVLVVGGGSRVAEIYDPSSGCFAPAGLTNPDRSGHSATLLHNGSVVVVGGFKSPEHFNRWAPRSCINDAITHRGEARLGPIRISGRASECKLSDEPHERSSTLIGNERTLT